MEKILRHYLWPVRIAAIAACAFFLGDAVARLVDARDDAWLIAGPLRHPRPRPHTPPAIDRNIFCSACSASDHTPPAVVERTDLPVELVATMCPVSFDDQCTLAVVRDRPGTVRGFLVGNDLQGATVTEIRPTRLHFTRNGRREYLDLLAGLPPPERFESAHPTPSIEAAADIRELGRDSYEVPRATVDRLLGNLNLVARSARIFPEVHDGRPAGFRLALVEHDGPLGRLGLQNGDLMLEVNGLSLGSVDSALDAYAKLRSTSHISLGLERNGRRMTKEVRIR